MGSFQYEALRMNDRSRVNGVINAATEREARELLREQDLMPTKIQAVGANLQGRKQKGDILSPVFKLIQPLMGISMKEKIAFTKNMEMMVKSGIPVTDALMYFENYVENQKFKKVLTQMRRDILSGYSLTQAMAKHKKLFNDVYINVSKAGEASGELEQAMGRLAELMHKTDKLRMKVISAMAYPVLVIGIMGLVLLIVFLWVLPTFSEIYEQMGVELPLVTVIMMAISTALRSFWWISFPLLIAGGVAFYKFFIVGNGRVIFDRVILLVPIVGELFKFVNNAHFISTFAVSFGAGLPITDAIFLATQTVQHTQIRKAFQNVNVQIQAGQRLGPALAATGYVPDLVLIMVSTGEETGELDKMLTNAHEYLDSEVDHRIEIMMAMLEPVMLVVLGIMVAFIALAIYLPMFSVYEHL